MRICVYLGSSAGNNPLYREAADQFGTLLAKRGIGLVYGGGMVGLMGVVADAVCAAGGEVHGAPTGYPSLDRMLMGLREGQLVTEVHRRLGVLPGARHLARPPADRSLPLGGRFAEQPAGLVVAGD